MAERGAELWQPLGWFNGKQPIYRGDEKLGVCGLHAPGGSYYSEHWVCGGCGKRLTKAPRIELKWDGGGVFFYCVKCGAKPKKRGPAEPRCSSCGQPPEPPERSGTTTVVGVDRAKGTIAVNSGSANPLMFPVVEKTREELAEMYPEPKRRRGKR